MFIELCNMLILLSAIATLMLDTAIAIATLMLLQYYSRVLKAVLQSKIDQSEAELTKPCSLIGGERVIFEWPEDSF